MTFAKGLCSKRDLLVVNSVVGQSDILWASCVTFELNRAARLCRE
mgnify:FL=1